jgi:hypothetical protein
MKKFARINLTLLLTVSMLGISASAEDDDLEGFDESLPRRFVVYKEAGRVRYQRAEITDAEAAQGGRDLSGARNYNYRTTSYRISDIEHPWRGFASLQFWNWGTEKYYALQGTAFHPEYEPYGRLLYLPEEIAEIPIRKGRRTILRQFLTDTQYNGGMEGFVDEWEGEWVEEYTGEIFSTRVVHGFGDVVSLRLPAPVPAGLSDVLLTPKRFSLEQTEVEIRPNTIETWVEVGEDEWEEEIVEGKRFFVAKSKITRTIDTLLTSVVNGRYGVLQSSNGDSFSPGSPYYAILAIRKHFTDRGLTPFFNEDDYGDDGED